MKLKFSADRKDWMLFGIYAVVLLYFVAIALLNIVSFANATDIDNMFHGFNPFPAFTGGYLPYTIIFYIIALVASITSVSDKFFDVEKGFGFSNTKKKDKGYSKWLDESEFKRTKNIECVRVDSEEAEAGGIPLMNNGRKMWVDNGEGHSLVMGSSGSGKTQMIILPMIKSLAKHNESMVIADPKGEIYEKTSRMLKEKGYNVILLNFRDPQKGSGWNPLHLPYQYYKNGNKDKANELVDDLGVNILYDENAQNSDPFWEKTSADYFSGLCLALFEDAKEEEINLNSINMFTTVGEEKSGPNITYVNEYFSYKDPTSPAYVSASSTLIAPTDTKGSILSVFKQKLRLFASRENLSEMLSHSDFELDEIGKRKTAVFIIIQDEKTTYHSLVTIFIKQCYETLIDCAQKEGGKLPYRTNFLLDEFANFPPLKDVETMVSAARSRNMRFVFIIQNFAQLSEKYGKNKGDTIKGNCTNIIYLISTELAALEEISKMCGEIKVKTGTGDKEKEENRPLITVSDLQKMSEGEVILLRTRLDPFRTKLRRDFETDWPALYKSDKPGAADYPSREKEEVKVFDLKGFVNKKKQNRVNQLMNGKGKAPAMPGKTPSVPNKNNAIKPQAKSNVDTSALIKKIEARIAELEEEDKKEKASMLARSKSKSGSSSMSTMPTLENTSTDNRSVGFTPLKPIKPISKIDKPKLETTSKKDVTPVPAVEPVKDRPKVNSVPKKDVVSEPIKKEVKEEKALVEPVKKEAVKEESKIIPATPRAKKELSISKDDFAAKVTSKVNKPKVEKKDYVTDDQFFDDFFADDDDY